MIITKRITIRGKYYQHTYSDAGYYIEREGIRYADAIDPYDLRHERLYTETDEKIPDEEDEEGGEE